MSFAGLVKQPPAFVLCTPWALYDQTGDEIGIGRRPLDPEHQVEVPAGMPIYLAAPDGYSVALGGHRLSAQKESRPFHFGHHPYQLYSLSIGTRVEDDRVTVRIDGVIAGDLQIVEHLPRPSWSLGRHSEAPINPRQERLDLLLLHLVNLIRLAEDPKVAWCESGWDRLANAWTGNLIDISEPPMALVVRHAETLQRLLNDLEHHPRHVLSRTRTMTPVDRVQQLDVASVRWLSRQPGHDVYERAGPRQRILAVQRFEDINTLENRVVRDFARRSRGLAHAYTKQYEKLQESSRWQSVGRYERECTRLARTLEAKEIALPRPPIVPNYALTHDRRYRRIWRAYQEVIQHIDEQDECWRWQHRLWTDFCRLLVQVALHTNTGFGAIAEAPLRIAQEQQHGCWSQVDAHSGTYLVNDTSKQPVAVLSLLWDLTAEHPKLEHWMTGLGAAAVLHIQNLEDGRESYLLLWPLHLFSQTRPPLVQIAASANRALRTALSNYSLHEGRDISAEALVLLSNVDNRRPETERSELVVAAHLLSEHADPKSAVERVGEVLHSMILRLAGKRAGT